LEYTKTLLYCCYEAQSERKQLFLTANINNNDIFMLQGLSGIRGAMTDP